MFKVQDSKGIGTGTDDIYMNGHSVMIYCCLHYNQNTVEKAKPINEREVELESYNNHTASRL